MQSYSGQHPHSLERGRQPLRAYPPGTTKGRRSRSVSLHNDPQLRNDHIFPPRNHRSHHLPSRIIKIPPPPSNEQLCDSVLMRRKCSNPQCALTHRLTDLPNRELLILIAEQVILGKNKEKTDTENAQVQNTLHMPNREKVSTTNQIYESPSAKVLVGPSLGELVQLAQNVQSSFLPKDYIAFSNEILCLVSILIRKINRTQLNVLIQRHSLLSDLDEDRIKRLYLALYYDQGGKAEESLLKTWPPTTLFSWVRHALPMIIALPCEQNPDVVRKLLTLGEHCRQPKPPLIMHQDSTMTPILISENEAQKTESQCLFQTLLSECNKAPTPRPVAQTGNNDTSVGV
ncbi:TPA: minor nucleoprotein [Tapajos virus]|uniref:Transcriptional activator VP30 n=1 Tax=Tapajos virus TaxID=2840185 RepID=A0AAD3AW42_9MONO|nr:minor nucleoprotein [Tapajos virus]FAA04061.1 TPA: minor nucleoprotein [Tapajos virus]